jgi:phosphatidylinositol alpha-mannosyltransferase
VDRVKILLVSPFDFDSPGGVNEHVRQLDREYQRLGHDTRVLAAASELGDSDDGHVLRLGASLPIPTNGSTARLTLSPFVAGRVKQFLATEPFDVIHLHEPLAPMLPLAVLLHSTSVNVGTFHAARKTNIWYMYTKAILDMFFSKLDARIAVSESAREFVDSYFPAHYEIIPNGISVENYHPDTPPLEQFDDGRPNILFVGRFDEPRKGFRHLIRAMPAVRSQFPSARLLVVGQGDASRYERFMAQHALTRDDVVFAGYVDDALKARYYASATVFCAPSTGRESFGLILLEALATGVPTIASDIPGYAAVIRQGIDGLLVEPKSADALALGIVRLLADSELRQRVRLHALARAEQFTWHEVARHVLELFERTLAAEQEQRSQLPWPAEMAGWR